MLSNLVCLGRHTITGLLCTSGRQFHDWTADYRIYAKPRVDLATIFSNVRAGILDFLEPAKPLIVAMDDSILRKSGKKTPGVAYRRDPLGPPFSVNFVRAQRILQLSAALPSGPMPAAARMIPVDFVHAPTPPKPRKQASPEAWQQYHRLRQSLNINLQGAKRLHLLRTQLDLNEHQSDRPLWVSVDGRFTNSTTLKNLPDRTMLIGRIRGDAKLYFLPSRDAGTSVGRKRSYGKRAPTPHQLQVDQNVPWKYIPAFACGKIHHFKIKTLAPLRWRPAGAEHNLRLIVVAPLGYRIRKDSKLLYRKPAYLIGTDPDCPLEKVLQAFIWRWDIEVNLRDEKQLVGVGEAQVRNQRSVETAPALAVAAYAILLLAAARAFGPSDIPNLLPLPKWRRSQSRQRASTGDLISHLRAELMAEAIHAGHFSGFSVSKLADVKPEKYPIHFPSAMVYATR